MLFGLIIVDIERVLGHVKNSIDDLVECDCVIGRHQLPIRLALFAFNRCTNQFFADGSAEQSD